jgi:hypothetical protein
MSGTPQRVTGQCRRVISGDALSILADIPKGCVGEPGGTRTHDPKIKSSKSRSGGWPELPPFRTASDTFGTTLPLPHPFIPHVRRRSPPIPPGEERGTWRVGVIASATFNSDRARCPGTEGGAASHVAPRPRCGARRHATTRRRGSSARFRPGWSEIQSIMALGSPRVIALGSPRVRQLENIDGDRSRSCAARG